MGRQLVFGGFQVPQLLEFECSSEQTLLCFICSCLGCLWRVRARVGGQCVDVFSIVRFLFLHTLSHICCSLNLLTHASRSSDPSHPACSSIPPASVAGSGAGRTEWVRAAVGT